MLAGRQPEEIGDRPQRKLSRDVAHEVELALRGGPGNDLFGSPLDRALEPRDGPGCEGGADHPPEAVVGRWVQDQHVRVNLERGGA